MSELRLEYLFEAYVNNKCSGREEEELMTFLSNPENEEQVQNLVDCFMENGVFEIQMSDVAAASMLNNILKKEQGFVIPKKNSKIGTSFWLGLAASVLIILGGIYTISVKYEDAIGKQDSSGQVAFTTYDSVNILPGANRVVLTTTDGHTIILDSAQN